ncbi:MAG: MotA/TolQ/ExbB proton channel family protein [Planctomycetota bacterium]|jgi:biopolymer transport protein ExbB
MPFDWINQGGPVMYPLLACSMAAVTIAIERLAFWWRIRRSRDTALVERMCELIGSGRYDEAEQISDGSVDPIARIFRFGLTHRHVSLEAALQMAAGTEIRGMRRYLKILDTIVTVAPLLGILGTVMGIIVSFDVIGGGRIDNPVEVTGGIAEALLTTAVGLVVAIMALIPYNYFVAKMEDAISELESHLTSFEILFKKGQPSNEA